MNNVWQRAVSYAALRHKYQVRKDGKTPYVAHPFRVAMVVRHVFGEADETTMVVALLHDLIEDTTTDYDDIAEQFGLEIADCVAALTKDSRLHQQLREDVYYKNLENAPWQAKLVKLADVYDNYCDAISFNMRQSIVTKARRAIQCAGDDTRLKNAVRLVHELLQQKH